MMTGQSMRLPEPHGLLLDRTRTITFEFEGEHFTGYRGDTIASALLANGQSVFSRSFKYHRPRGVLTMAGLDANTYVQIGDAPNQSADQVLITEGLSVQAQNVWGSLKFDRGRIFEAFARFMPVGFYYKAFYRPQGVWNYWEKLIRAASGLGKVHLDTPHGYYDKQYLFADVAVIGGGPAGLSAALKAAGAGAEVILIDEAETLGGSLNYAFAKAGQKRAQELKARALASSNLTILDQATCSGWFADNWLAATRSNRLYKIRATQVILATGLVEQPMVFRNNDLPGILLGSAAQRLIRLYGVRPGRKAVVAIGHPDGFAVVKDLVEVGIGIAAVSVLDQTDIPESERIFLEARKIPVIRDSSLYEAYANKKTGAVQAVKVQRISGRTVTHEGERIECDLVVTSVGYSPLGQLACHSGGRMIYDERLATLVIDQRPHASHLAGSVNGHHDIEAVIADGERAGAEAATALGFECDHLPMPDDQKPRLNHPFPIFPHPEGKDFVDFDEDQVTKDINNAVLDGFEQVELVKRYTTTGMGPSQGRHSALNVLRLTQFYRQTPTEQVMVTTQRPPFKPESFGHLAGRRFEPVRHTAAHQRHLELGATMMPAGLWMRPAFYGPKQGSAAQIAAEVKSVRKNVGLIDVSTLGGLEVRGPDAAEFLNRMYTFRYIKQPVGRSRYVLMTDQAGAIIDDGVACRLQEDHFYVTATTGGVDDVYRSMLHWNAQWCLDVDVANVTSAYAGFNLAGPKSRQVLKKLNCNIDLDAAAFPYLGVRQGVLEGISVRVLRVGFVGELSYEIHCPSAFGEALWDRLMQAGESFDLRPVGVEAQRLLRLEKGHIIVGQDTDGLTFPQEVDMTWALAQKKPYFQGKRSIEIRAAQPLTRKLVGFTLPDSAPVPPECCLVIKGDLIVGRVTSAGRSDACGFIIGLAYVHPDDAQPGAEFIIKLEDGTLLKPQVQALPFYDPQNKRQKM